MENSKETKTHYRAVFKSDHLGVADLEEMIEEGKQLIFTIKEVKQEYGVKVAGRKGDHNIAYFENGIKPLVLNSHNSKIMKTFADGSPFVEDWNSKLIELYIDPNVTFGGEKTGGVRIRPKQPVISKQELTPNHKRWADALKAVQEGKLASVQKQFTISAINLEKLKA